jgi:hypothetical protein
MEDNEEKNYENMPYHDLRKYCKSLGLTSSGKVIILFFLILNN